MEKVKKLVFKKTSIANLDDFSMNYLRGGTNTVDTTGPGSTIQTHCNQFSCNLKLCGPIPLTNKGCDQTGFTELLCDPQQTDYCNPTVIETQVTC